MISENNDRFVLDVLASGAVYVYRMRSMRDRSLEEPFACTDEVGEGWIARAARARTTSEIACRMNVTAGCSTATPTPCDQGVKTLVGTSWPRGMSDAACPQST
jgi:hypothetical protein